MATVEVAFLVVVEIILFTVTPPNALGDEEVKMVRMAKTPMIIMGELVLASISAPFLYKMWCLGKHITNNCFLCDELHTEIRKYQ